MKVYSGKGALMRGRTMRPACYLLLIVVLTLSAAIVPQVRGTPPQQKAKEISDRLDRDARKAIRAGKYDDALKIYLGMIEADARDNRARLGAIFA